jgi:hypothetical protein
MTKLTSSSVLGATTSFLVVAVLLAFSTIAIPFGVAFAQQQPQQGSTLSGIITSTQINQAGAPQWLTAGSWTLVTDRPVFGGEQTTTTGEPKVMNFSAVLVMTLINNGTMTHSHRLSDFKQSTVTHPGGNTTIINGTMTVTTEQGPTPNVPSFLLFQNDRMSVWVNPVPLHNHFGPTSLITGIIVNPQLLAQVRSMEAPSVQPGGGAAGSTR